MHAILSEIYPKDIYEGFVPSTESVSGWGGDDPIFSELITQTRPKAILEVGTWKGMSALAMAKACKREELDCAIICIDTWLGSEEHILKDHDELRSTHGYPTIYFQFLSNVVNRGAQDLIVPLPTTSLAAAAVLKELEIRADLIYIDANHQYDAVLADLRAFMPILNTNGVMFGHDVSWESVHRAVRDFCDQQGIGYRARGDFWILHTRGVPYGHANKL